MTLGERVGLAIKNSGYKKIEIADKIGISPPALSKIINGDTVMPSEQTIRSLCRVLHINRAWLETGEGEMKPPPERDEILVNTFAEILRDSSTEKARFIKAISALPDSCYPILVDAIIRIAEDLQRDAEAKQAESGTEADGK